MGVKKKKPKHHKNMKDSRGNYFIAGDTLISRIEDRLTITCISINKKGGRFTCNSDWFRKKEKLFITKRKMKRTLWIRR